jgi:hypothetical protein
VLLLLDTSNYPWISVILMQGRHYQIKAFDRCKSSFVDRSLYPQESPMQVELMARLLLHALQFVISTRRGRHL